MGAPRGGAPPGARAGTGAGGGRRERGGAAGGAGSWRPRMGGAPRVPGSTPYRGGAAGKGGAGNPPDEGARRAARGGRRGGPAPEDGPASHLVGSAVDHLAGHGCPDRSEGVVARAVPVDDDDGLVTDHPGVVALGQRGDIARLGDELGAVVHPDAQPAAHVELHVRCLAAVGAGDGLDVVRPAPARLEDQPADLATTYLDDLCVAAGKFTDLVGLREGPVL